MAADTDAIRARRYVLGQASEEECSAIEREYFGDEAAVIRIAAAEDDLIEDYLDDRLPLAERAQFERHYLASSLHRRRVGTVRQLSAGKAGTATRFWRPLAAAAVLAIAATSTLTLIRHGSRIADRSASSGTSTTPSTAVSAQRSNPSTEPARPRVFTLSISSAAVRSAGDARTAAIPAGTEVVVLDLESELTSSPIAAGRVVVRTVAGADVWRGLTTIGGVVPAGVIARVDVPAARLPVDDYVIELFGTDASGVEREQGRYFLRVLP